MSGLAPPAKRKGSEKPQTYRLYVAMTPSTLQAVKVHAATESQPIADILGGVISQAVSDGRIGGKTHGSS